MMFTSLLLALTSPALADTAVHRFALLVGTNAAGTDRERLRYAVDDARSMSQVLTELGGVAPEDTFLVADPGRAQLITALGTVRTRVASAEAAQQRTDLVVYYSGHSDEQGLLLGNERFEYEELRRAVDNIPADVRVVVLDSCASGALVRSKGGTIRPAFLVDDSVALSGTAYLTSSSAEEMALESDTLGGSYFTHNLVSGLRGAADTSGDGRVSLSEAYTYVYGTTLARTEKTLAGAQHPTWDLRLVGTGDLVMTEITSNSTGLLADESIDGHITVRDADQRLVAELQKPADRRLELGLSPGKYTVLLERDGRLREASFVIGGAGLVSLAGLSFADVKGQVARARGTTEYADVPFSFGIFPTVTRRGLPIKEHLSLSLGIDAAGALDGTQIALGGASVRDRARGAQIAVGYTWAGQDLQGVQLAAGGAFVGGNAVGGQVTDGLNIVGGDLHGGQVTAGVNITRGEVVGFQVAAGGNVAGQKVTGVQVAAGANIARDVDGFQITSGLNVATDVDGAQIGLVDLARDVDGTQVGIVDVARDVDGAQVSVVNVARKVDFQLGVVNFADDAEVAIGVLSFSRTGYNHVIGYVDANGSGVAGVTFGSKRLYTTLQAGAWADAPSPWTIQLGVGGHFGGDPLFVDAEVTAGTLGRGLDAYTRQGTLLTRGRVVVGHAFAPHFAVFAGPTLSMEVLGEHQLPDRAWLPTLGIPAGDGAIPVQVGLAAGVRI